MLQCFSTFCIQCFYKPCRRSCKAYSRYFLVFLTSPPPQMFIWKFGSQLHTGLGGLTILFCCCNNSAMLEDSSEQNCGSVDHSWDCDGWEKPLSVFSTALTHYARINNRETSVTQRFYIYISLSVCCYAFLLFPLSHMPFPLLHLSVCQTAQLPQLWKVLRARSASGISWWSVLLQVYAITGPVVYCITNNFPLEYDQFVFLLHTPF